MSFLGLVVVTGDVVGKFVMNNFSPYASVTQMLTSLNWPTLAQCRQQERATMLFKMIHNLVDIPAC